MKETLKSIGGSLLLFFVFSLILKKASLTSPASSPTWCNPLPNRTPRNSPTMQRIVSKLPAFTGAAAGTQPTCTPDVLGRSFEWFMIRAVGTKVTADAAMDHRRFISCAEVRRDTGPRQLARLRRPQPREQAQRDVRHQSRVAFPAGAHELGGLGEYPAACRRATGGQSPASSEPKMIVPDVSRMAAIGSGVCRKLGPCRSPVRARTLTAASRRASDSCTARQRAEEAKTGSSRRRRRPGHR